MDIRRAAEHHLVMEAIYGTITDRPAEGEAEADQKHRHKEEARAYARDLPAMRVYMGNPTNPLPTLPAGTRPNPLQVEAVQDQDSDL